MSAQRTVPTGTPRRTTAVAALLALVAGYVDGLGFLATGGLFVSFMSGNSTASAVQLWQGALPMAALGASIVASFVAGVTAAAVLVRRLRHSRSRVLLLIIAGLLALSEVLRAFYTDSAWTWCLVAAGMGAINVVFADGRRAPIAVTYATGGLVAVGLGIAQALTGHARTTWRRPLLLWASLVTGAVIGAAAHTALGPAAVPLAAAALVVLALLPARVYDA
jgi:uncharacterized membrane protein YoaK (UPF0700 family)